MPRSLTPAQTAARSVIKKYRKELWNPFTAAVTRYELLAPGDHVAVCISGGKDSMLMAVLMRQLQQISDFPFDLTYLVMDPGYNEKNRRKIEENAALLEIPLTIFETDIFDAANSVSESPCYLSARMRRGHLYHKAQDLCCNKIALGHHLNDAIETVLMSMFYSAKIETMIPKVHSDNFPGMELIRPMYGIREEDIIAWAHYNSLEFIRCACRFTERTEALLGLNDKESLSKRREVKELIRLLSKENPDIEHNIWNALHNVQIDTFPGYTHNRVRESFLKNYSAEESEDA